MDTKDIILNDLETRFEIHILQKHWHRLDEKGLQHILRVPHLACLRSNGNPYFMFFTKYEDVPIIFFVDKKVQPGYQKPRMIIGRGQWDESLSNGTVIDGEMVKDNEGKWIFLLNDLIAYEGKHLTSEHLPERLKMLTHMLEKQYIPQKTLDVCTYEIKRYAHASQQGTSALVEWSKELKYTNRGIYYWPFSRKYKPKLYNFDDSLIKSVSLKVKDKPEFRLDDAIAAQTGSGDTAGCEYSSNIKPSLPQTTLIEECEGTRTLWLRKTEYPDVYDIYPTDNGMLHGNKMGIAYVKTLEDSRWLRELFKTATVAVYIPFMCTKMNNNPDRWKPIAVAS